HHVRIAGRFAVTADNVFHDLIQLAIAESPLNLRQGHRCRWLQPHGVADQRTGAFRAVIAGVGLGDGLEKVHPQAAALQRADESKTDRGETDSEPGGGEKERMHQSVSCSTGWLALKSSSARHSSVICRSSSVGMTRMAGELPAWICRAGLPGGVAFAAGSMARPKSARWRTVSSRTSGEFS